MSLVLVSLLTRLRLTFLALERKLILAGSLTSSKALIYRADAQTFAFSFSTVGGKGSNEICSREVGTDRVHWMAFWISSTRDDNLTFFSWLVFISFRRTLPSLTSLGPRTRDIFTFNESAYSSCLLSGRCLPPLWLLSSLCRSLSSSPGTVSVSPPISATPKTLLTLSFDSPARVISLSACSEPIFPILSIIRIR